MRFFVCILLFTIISCTNESVSEATRSIEQAKSDSAEFTFSDPGFETFYQKFITDSVFQISQVDFPIAGTYADYDTTRAWSRNTWPIIAWDFRDQINTTNDSLKMRQNDSVFFFGQYCRDCGFSFEMEFKKIAGEWKMTQRQENNY